MSFLQQQTFYTLTYSFKNLITQSIEFYNKTSLQYLVLCCNLSLASIYLYRLYNLTISLYVQSYKKNKKIKPVKLNKTANKKITINIKKTKHVNNYIRNV